MSLQVITVSPSGNQPPQSLIVLLHGWGANAQDLFGLAQYLDLPQYQLVFPNAPFPHPYNSVGKMWYALPESYSFLGKPEFSDRPDLSASRQQLLDLLKDLSNTTGVPPSQIILGGFSQGGAMTLDVGVRLPLAGLMVLSGYLHAPLQPQTDKIAPVLLIHGRQDTVVPLQAATQTREQLETLGVQVRYQDYAMGHEIQPIVLEQIQTFVKEILPGR